MNTLDSPLEALAFNYLGYAFLAAVNSLWAWVAVATAAVSFWKIRASSTPPVSRSEPRSWSQKDTSTPSPPSVAAQPFVVSSPVNTEKELLSTSNTTSCCVLETEGSTKVKFTLYYEEDAFTECDQDDECDGVDEGVATAVVSEEFGRRCEDWEKMMMVRMGDMGWDRCQDLMALNGSVVRLWDGSRRRQVARM